MRLGTYRHNSRNPPFKILYITHHEFNTSIKIYVQLGEIILILNRILYV